MMQVWAFLGVSVFLACIGAIDTFRKADSSTREAGRFLMAAADFVAGFSAMWGAWLLSHLVLFNQGTLAPILVCAGVWLFGFGLKRLGRKMKSQERLS
jgi:UDP-N-acetylmuramyl pentapeptide phosphotransferase/UDP-N-acetylglucosamine-1-phosphate transferase